MLRFKMLCLKHDIFKINKFCVMSLFSTSAVFNSRIYLHVPFSQKDQVKVLGGRWDAAKKQWYVTDENLCKVLKWYRTYITKDEKLQSKYSDAIWDHQECKWYVLGHHPDSVAKIKLIEPVPLRSHSVNSLSQPVKNCGLKVTVDDVSLHRAVFFDIETNGLPGAKDNKDRFDSSRIVQMSYMLCDCKDLLQVGSLESSQEFEAQLDKVGDVVIKSDGFAITNHSIHGITLDRSLSEGQTFVDSIALMTPTFLEAKYIIAHNAEFDIPIFKSELERYGQKELLSHLNSMTVVCSMLKTKPLLNLSDKWNRLKNPSLKELYKYACQKDITNQHNAKYDVFNLYEAVRALVSKDMIKLDVFFASNNVKRN